MVVKFHGHTSDGAFQTGKAEVLRFYSAHHMEATGVIATRVQLVSDGILSSATLSASNNIVIQGVNYTTNAGYDDAFWAQQNLDALVGKMTILANPVFVDVNGGATGILTTVTPTGDSNGALVAGSQEFGTQLIAANGPVWQVQMTFEQKGIFNNASGTSTFVKGEPSLGVVADNYGTSVAELDEYLDSLALVSTSVDDANAEDILGGATTPGSAILVRTTTNEAAERSLLTEVDVAPELQIAR